MVLLRFGDNMEEVGYNLTKKEFKSLSKWAENVYNIAVVVGNPARVIKYLDAEKFKA